jgi:hypothetical protein
MISFSRSSNDHNNDLPVRRVASKLVVRITANCGIASRKMSRPHASPNVKIYETQYEEILTGAGDEQHYRKDDDAPIAVPDDITTVNLKDD